jgi:transposase
MEEVYMSVGLDVHKGNRSPAMMDGKGTVLERNHFPTTREDLDEFAWALSEGSKVAIEASTSGVFAHECLDESGIEVHLAHTALVKPFPKKHIKTENLDSGVLVHLLRLDYLLESYVPEKALRDLLTLVRHRANLVRIRTTLKNHVHALLTREASRHRRSATSSERTA